MTSQRIEAVALKATARTDWQCCAEAHGTCFDSLDWLEVQPQGTQAVGLFDGGGNLRGGFSYREDRILGFKTARNPFYTPSIGPFFESRATNPSARVAEIRAVLSAITRHFESRRCALMLVGLRPSIVDPLPFFWSGWKVVPHITYRLDLRNSSDDLFASLSSERRKSLRKAQRLDLDSVEAIDNDQLIGLVGRTFDRQGRSWPEETTARILDRFNSSHSGFSIAARTNNTILAGAFFFHDETTAYYLMGGYADNAGHAAGPFVMWNAIQKAKSLGLETFDFEGSMIPDIERYFRGFGGTLTPYFTVNRAWFPLEMLLKIKHRNRF